MDKKISCSILTPEKIVFEGQVDYIIVPAYDGEMGFLYNHAPLIAELGIGEARLKTAGKEEFVAVHGGFVEIRNNEMAILAEAAYRKNEIDVEATQKKLDEYLKDVTHRPYDEKFKWDNEIKKLRVNLKLAARQ